jgi:outer membrane protein TolC
VALLGLAARAQDAPGEGAGGPRAARGGGLELTLDEAVAIVLERNLELQLELLATEVARFNSYGTWGAFDPVASASLNYFESEQESSTNTEGGQGFVLEIERRSFQNNLNFPLVTGGNLDLEFRADNTETSNPNASLGVATDSSVSVTLTQPLLRGAWNRYATTDQRLSEIEYAKQLERQRRIRQDLLLRVHEAYWNLVESIEQVLVRELSLQLGQEQLDQDRRRLEVGVGTEVDVLQAETNVATNEEQLLLAELNAEAAMDTMKSLLFRRDVEQDWDAYLGAWETPIVPLTQLPEVAHDTMEWTRSLGRALALRSELTEQRLELDARSMLLYRAESDVLPGLDLTLSASNRGFDVDATDSVNEAFGTEFPTYAAGLAFDIPIFNRSASFARRVARANVRSARLTYDRAEQDVVSDVRSKVRDVNYQAKAVQAAKKSRELAERQLQAEQARYEEGLSTTFQVLEFQKTLAEALSAEKAARAAFARNVAKLRRAEGWLGETVTP